MHAILHCYWEYTLYGYEKSLKYRFIAILWHCVTMGAEKG